MIRKPLVSAPGLAAKASVACSLVRLKTQTPKSRRLWSAHRNGGPFSGLAAIRYHYPEAGKKPTLGRFRHRIPQACLGFVDDLLIVIGGDSLHVDTCAFDACVLRQPLELDLNLFRFFGVKRVTGSVVDLPVAV